jgi:hypothetical protein
MSLYRQSGIWYSLFYVDGVRYRRSTKSRDQKQARQIAARIYVAIAGQEPSTPVKPYVPQRSQWTYPDKVYLLRAGHAYKIGVASKVELRACDLQTGCPYPVEIIGQWSHGDAYGLEQQLHSMFAAKRLAGEWFALTEQDVVAIREFFRRKLC